MIRLRPAMQLQRHRCPFCQEALGAHNWYVPGMRCLADLHCDSCGREFYGDLPAGQGFYTPLLLEKKTGRVAQDCGVEWFADWLRSSYARRSDDPLDFTVRRREDEEPPATERRAAVLLNCLDAVYGHSLLKLLNAPRHLDDLRPDGPTGAHLIVLVPRRLAWLVPDGVAETWIVDLPFARGAEWNDWLAGEIRRRLDAYDDVYLSVAFSHPHPLDYEIERLTRVAPFPRDEWRARLSRPTVTFIWREDRLWCGDDRRAAPKKWRRRIFARGPSSHSGASGDDVGRQGAAVIALADELRERWPTLDFAVAGFGARTHLPSWIEDLRVAEIGEETERRWCARYAASHLVVGVHGSNMLLPSAHAGGVVEIIDEDRWGNSPQDILLRASDDARLALFYYRLLPAPVAARGVARWCDLMLRRQPDAEAMLGREAVRHRLFE